MAKNTHEEMEKRRAQVWEMLVRGIPHNVIASTLGVHRNTVSNDVRVLRDRHREEVKDVDVFTTIGDAAAKFDAIFKHAMQEYSTAKNAREKGVFMEKAMTALDKKTRLLVETGVLPKAAQEITGKMVVEGLDVHKASLQELRQLHSRMKSKLESLNSTNRISGMPSDN